MTRVLLLLLEKNCFPELIKFITMDCLNTVLQLQLFTFNTDRECYQKAAKNTKLDWLGQGLGNYCGMAV
jgi:hypothetical protein